MKTLLSAIIIVLVLTHVSARTLKNDYVPVWEQPIYYSWTFEIT